MDLKLEKNQHVSLVVYDGNNQEYARNLYEQLMETHELRQPVKLVNTDFGMFITDVLAEEKGDPINYWTICKITVKGVLI